MDLHFQANAVIGLEAGVLFESKLRTRRTLSCIYNFYINGITTVLCSCLKLCKCHLEFLEVLGQAADFGVSKASTPTQMAHDRVLHSWSKGCDHLFDRIVDLIADFEEQVQWHIYGNPCELQFAKVKE